MSNIKSIQPLGFPWATQDPFLFCVHHLDKYPQGNQDLSVDHDALKGRMIGQDFNPMQEWRMYHGKTVPGFPFHPHRGFETITINKQGVVDHSDSLGAAGRFMDGDVQWMTAGRGVQHSEMFPLLHRDKANTLEIFQIWLNLPKASKMADPHFKMLWKEDIPRMELTDAEGKKAFIDVIAGRFDTTEAPDPTPDSWASNPDNAVGVYTIKLEAGAKLTIPGTAAEANRTVFYYDGDTISIDGEKMKKGHLANVIPQAALSIQNGNAPSYLLMLEGKPIGEPVVQHGPFVMNSEEEIRQTMAEYQRTQFGGWPWPQVEQVHAPEKGRFALHADGREEIK